MTAEKDLADLSGIVATRASAGLHKLMSECMEDLLARKDELPTPEKLPPGVPAETSTYFVAVRIAASTIIAGLLRQLREAGCPDDIREDIVQKAVALEASRATS